MQDVLVAVDVQEGFLLAGEGGVRKVFRGGRGPHREAALAFGSDRLVGGLDLGLEPGREGNVDDPLADLRAGLRQGVHVIHVQRVERGVDAVGEAVVGEEFAIRFRGRGKPARHPHTRRQLADHFAERGVLAADQLHVGHAQFVEGDDVTGH